jgi:hypothetical protein
VASDPYLGEDLRDDPTSLIGLVWPSHIHTVVNQSLIGAVQEAAFRGN